MTESQAILLKKPPARRWWVMVMGILAYGHFFMTIQLISAMTTTIMEDLSIGATQATWLITACMIGFGALTLAGGPIGTKFGPRKTITAGLVVNAIASFLFLIGAQNYTGAFILRFLQGCGGGLISGSAIGSTALWFPTKSRGLATGIFTGLVGSMFTVAVVFCPILLNLGFTWQQTIAIMGGIPATIFAVIFFTTVKDFKETYPGYESVDGILSHEVAMPKREKQVKSNIKEVQKPSNMQEFFKSKYIWMAGIIIFVNGWMQHGLGSLFPQFLLFEHNLPTEQVASITGFAFLGMMIACPLGGLISDNLFRGKRYPILAIGAGLTGILFLLIPKAPLSIMALVLFLTYGANALVSGPFWSLPSELVTPKMAVMASAFCSTLGTLGGLIGSPLMTVTATQSGTYLTPIYICAALALLAVIPPFVIKQ